MQANNINDYAIVFYGAIQSGDISAILLAWGDLGAEISEIWPEGDDSEGAAPAAPATDSESTPTSQEEEPEGTVSTNETFRFPDSTTTSQEEKPEGTVSTDETYRLQPDPLLRDAQRILNDWNSSRNEPGNLEEHGLLDPATQAALLAFQQSAFRLGLWDHPLGTTGTLTDSTYRALLGSGFNPPKRRPHKRPHIRGKSTQPSPLPTRSSEKQRVRG